MRRLIALLLLIVGTAFNMEAVTGLLRDGAVHHEDPAAAAVHADAAAGEHGHEDASGPSGNQSEDHEHGTSSDHCTHQHGIALVPTIAFTIVSTEGLIEHSERLLPHPIISESPVHPPRV